MERHRRVRYVKARPRKKVSSSWNSSVDYSQLSWLWFLCRYVIMVKVMRICKLIVTHAIMFMLIVSLLVQGVQPRVIKLVPYAAIGWDLRIVRISTRIYIFDIGNSYLKITLYINEGKLDTSMARWRVDDVLYEWRLWICTKSGQKDLTLIHSQCLQVMKTMSKMEDEVL